MATGTRTPDGTSACRAPEPLTRARGGDGRYALDAGSSQRGQKSSGEYEYAAFVSHMKAETAMEARFIQTELEALIGERCFLDSDDLKDLAQLTAHVRASRAVLLIQSKSVLTRPWCFAGFATVRGIWGGRTLSPWFTAA